MTAFRFQVWAARYDESKFKPFNYKGPLSAPISIHFELQGEFDEIEEAAEFAKLLMKCGKWNTLHLREVTR